MSALRFWASELRLVFGRRRNQLGLAVLAVVPVLMGVALKLQRGRPGGGLIGAATNGPFLAVASLTLETTIFLPLAIAMVAGDSIAGEANQGTLRYLLTVPVGRTRLLAVKYASIVVGALVAVTVVALTGVVLGAALFGLGPTTTLSGTQLPFAAALGRVVLVALYLAAGIAALGAVGLFLSTLTEQPLAATIATMVVVALSWVAEGVSQLAWLQPWLLTHWYLSAIDLVRDPLYTTNVVRGLGLDAVYAVVFLLAAWARLSTKDVTS